MLKAARGAIALGPINTLFRQDDTISLKRANAVLYRSDLVFMMVHSVEQ